MTASWMAASWMAAFWMAASWMAAIIMMIFANFEQVNIMGHIFHQLI